MIAKGTVITHGSNAVRYSADKEKAEIIKVNNLPENITSSAIWTRMMALQQQFKEKTNRHRRMKNTSIRIELSPAREEAVDWTIHDWAILADEFISEFDAVDLSKEVRRESARCTNLQNSQYVVSLHSDSKSGILHLHINANRIDMEGHVNDAHFINRRAMMAADKIAEKRGWVQAKTKRIWNIEQITDDCISILKDMDSFSWTAYETRVKAKGYDIKFKFGRSGIVVGYSIGKGNSWYKSSELGHSRNLTPSRIMRTWEKLHQQFRTASSIPIKDTKTVATTDAKVPQPSSASSIPKQVPTASIPNRPEPVLRHHDISVKDKKYSVDIPEEVNDVLMNDCTMPDNFLWSTLADIQHTAMLLFAGYVDEATELSQSCGGGGSSAESGWGKKEDEDDFAWARRCALRARQMHTRPARRYHR